MTERITALRSLHDMGLAAWFGGALMGAVGLNGAARRAGSTEEASRRIESTGWAMWTPVNAAAVAVHLVGSAALLKENAARVAGQKGVGASTAAKTAVTGAALAATAYSRALGKKVEKATTSGWEAAGESAGRNGQATAARRQLAVMQWTVPALTGGLLVLNALHGEQQRPWQQVRGMLENVLGH
ncbi:hypothetical protein ABZ920_14315 [Streptomyces sp. NPDC046831]|uniref:hypothetical protein n=1 Tax=Streptomyces sp. NPDC046831 TaxID=3154805 RepID=UPI0033C59B19